MTLPGLVPVAPPYVPPPLDLDPGWTKLRMSLIDANGHEWDLNDDRNGITVLRGVTGLQKPKYTTYNDKSPAVAGSYYRGSIADERPVIIPIALFHDGSTQEWADLDDAFISMLHPDTPHVWEVSGPHGIRRIKVRYARGADGAYDMDPTFFGWAKYPLEFTTDNVYWEGDPIVVPFSAAEPALLYGPSGKGPSFYVSGSRTLDGATVTVPGNVDPYPKITVVGPTTDSTAITINGHTVGFDFEIASGHSLTIDMHPRAQTALLDGVTDKIKQLTSWDFAPLPKGADIPIDVSIGGVGGKIVVEFTPLYERAW